MSDTSKLACAGAALALVLVGCGSSDSTAPTTQPDGGPTVVNEGQLDIVAWPGYIERGESDKAYDWVTPFEKATGCKITVTPAGTSDEMVALMDQGGYDLVTASGDASLRLVAAGTVTVVDVSRVPSYATVDPRLQNAAWHTVDGKHYGVPYQWGANVLMYNTTVFKDPPTSWSATFEPQNLPDGKPNSGRLQAFDGPIYLADAALYLMTKKPQLGIQDPYALNEAQYSAVLDLLMKQRPLVNRYWHNADVQVTDFEMAGAVVSGSWPYQVNALQLAKQPIASVIPAEGATGWADTTMLASTSKHPNCAYAWLEWSINPKVQGDVAAWFGSVPAVPNACTASDLLGKDGCTTNGAANFDKIHFWRTPEAKCAQGQCVPYSRWSQDYGSLMGG